MRFKSGAEMLKRIASDVVVGQDEVLSADDPRARTIGFVVRRGRDVVYYTPLTQMIVGLDEDQRKLLGSQEGRKKMAQLLQSGVPKHGHGFKHSRECLDCLASEVMTS